MVDLSDKAMLVVGGVPPHGPEVAALLEGCGHVVSAVIADGAAALEHAREVDADGVVFVGAAGAGAGADSGRPLRVVELSAGPAGYTVRGAGAVAPVAGGVAGCEAVGQAISALVAERAAVKVGVRAQQAPAGARRPVPALRWAGRLLLTIALAAFGAEFSVMVLIGLMKPMAFLPEALFDASMLTVLIFPFLYLFAFRPLVAQLNERARIDEALQRLNEELEARVGARTAELAGANEALRRAHDELEVRVAERTSELARAKAALEAELAERERAETALRESEELLRKVLELLPVGVWILDEHGTVVSGNVAAQRIWAGAQFVGSEEYGVYRAWRLDTGKPLAPEEWSASRALADGKPFLNQVVEIEAFDGTRKILDNSAVPLIAADGRVTGAIVVNEDISERVRAERALRRYAEEQKALYTVTAAASTILDPGRLLDAVLDAVLPVVAADAGWVTLVGPDPEGLPRIPAFKGVSQEFARAEESCPLRDCSVCWARVQAGGSSSESQELSACPRLPPDVLAASGLQSHAGVALQAGARVVGVLSIGWRGHHDYSVAERALLEAIGVQVGIALHNAQLYQAEQRARRTAETLRLASLALTGTLDLVTVVSSLLGSLRQLIPFDRARVMLREGDGRVAVRAAATSTEGVRMLRDAPPRFDPSSNRVINALLTDGNGFIIPDIHRHPEWGARAKSGYERSWMGVPLVAGNEVIGMYSVSKAEAGFFGDEHLQLAQTLAAPAAMAIQNASLFEQVRAGRTQLQALSRQLVEVQESERRTVTRELHDEAGQALSSLMIGLRLLEREAGRRPALLARIGELKRVADGVQEGLHRLATNLRPASLDHLGLVAALRQYVEGLNVEGGPAVEFEPAGSDRWRLPDDVETALYRIAQEALTNAIRHARASRISVLLQRRARGAVLVVSDDGVGFCPEEVAAKGRLGLIGMRERAEAVGGWVAIKTGPGEGTTVTVEVSRVHPHRHPR